MKILRVADIPSSHPGGMLHAMKGGGKALVKAGHEVEYLFKEDLGWVPASPALRRLACPWLVVIAVRRLMRQGKCYDVVEIHEPLAAAYTFARRWLRLPPCVVFSHGLEARSWLSQLKQSRLGGRPVSLKSRIAVPATLLSQARFALKRAQHVIVLTDDDRRFLIDRMKIPAEKISRVDNGAPDELLHVEGEPEEKRIRLIFFGSWTDRKGITTLVDALSQMRSTAARWHLTVAGSNEPAASILPYFINAGPEQISVEGTVGPGQVPHLLGRHDVLIAPSFFEGMPLGVLEAAAAGLAIIASDISGHRQIFGEKPASRGAILIPPHDPGALCQAILRLCKDRALLRKLKEAARQTATRLSWHAAARQLEIAYTRALSPDPTGETQSGGSYCPR